MDDSTFSCCLRNKRTSGSSVWTVTQGCTDYSQTSENLNPLKPACTSCSRNFMKCKPWRRKSSLNTALKWTWFNMFSCLNLILLLASLSHVVLRVLSRTITTKKTSRLRLDWVLLIVGFLGGVFLPVASCQESLQPTPSVKSQLPNAVVYVGSVFSYNISTSVFDCEVDSIVVSETADRFLSHWLSYNNKKKQLYGVPSDKDEGTYNILVVALTKDGAVRGHVCGSRSFSIVVMPVSEELPVSVHFGTGASRSYHKSAHSLSCVPGTQAVLGTVILNADMQGLNGHERMVLLLKMADHLNIHASKLSFFSGETSHPLTQYLDNPAVMAAGVGDGRFAKGSRSLLTWNIGCGAFKLEDAAFSRLETDAQDGTISALLGFPVVGWHVMSGAQKNIARRRIRRAAGGIGSTPTPTATSAPPSRMSSMSTIVITSRTVTLTSAFSVNSTIIDESIRSSISATSSSVAPNRTVIESSGVSINSTVFSQSPTRTIQSLTLSVNLTVSSQPPNRTDIQSSTISINLTASSQLFSRTVIQPSSVANFSSQATTFSPTSIFSSPILTPTLTVTSSTPVMSRNATQIVNRTSSAVTTPSLNSTFITRTATTNISSSVMITSSLSPPATTRTMNSSDIALSPNKSSTIVLSSTIVPSISTSQVTTSSSNVTTLLPSTPQVNSSVMIRTSSFTVSSNRTTLIFPTSLLSSTSQVLTITSVTIISSSQLNSSTLNATLPSSTRQTTPAVIISSSSMTIANTSVPVTTSVNQTSLPTTSKASNSSSISSPRLTSTFSIPSSSSLVILIPNTTSVGNVTSFVTSSFITSLPTVSSSTSQLESTTVLNRTSPILTSTSFVSSVLPTMSSTETSFTTTSSLVPSSLNSSVVLSSSLSRPSSSLVSPSSSSMVNVTSVVGNVTSATLQPNVTSTTAVVLSSLTASPLVTSVNLTSVVKTTNTSTTKRTALVNSTSISGRSTFVTLTTSAFPPTRTSGTRTFPSTFATNRTFVVTTSRGVDKPSVNISSTPKITTTTLLSSSDSSLSTFQLSSVVTSSVLTPSFTKLSNSSFVTVSASSEVRLNSTAVSRTQESSATPSTAVTRLVNSSVTQTTIISSTQTVSSTVFVVTSTLVSSLSRRFTNTSSLVPPSSETVFASSTVLLPNASSLVAVSKTSVTFSSTVTLIQSSVLNSSSFVFTNSSSTLKSSTLLTTAIFTGNRTVISTTEVSLTRTTPLMNSSLFTSTLKSQNLTTVFSTSGIVKSSEVLQNTTMVLSTNATVSPSSSAVVSSSSLVLRSSTFFTALPTTVTVIPTSATVIPTSTIVIPTSSPIQNATMMSSSSRIASPSSVSTPLLTRSTLQTELSIPVNSTQSTRTVTRSTRVPLASSTVVSVSSRIPSSVQPSVTVILTSRPSVNRTTSILDTSGTLPSSSALPSSNTTLTVTATDTTQTVVVLPTSSVPPTPPPNFPPVLLNNIGRVRAPTGKALHYTIPDDTFYDREDRATTRNLTLSISLANGSSIPTDFWLQFDTTSQTINGLPLNEHVPDGIVGEVFVLHARDKNSLEARDAFEVFVVPLEKPVVQELRVRIRNDFASFSRNLTQRLSLLKKIAEYYGDADESNIRVLSFTPGSVIMTWTNDSLPTDSCDQEKVQYVANKILLPNGDVREEFAVALEGFLVESASEERFGVCNGSFIVPTEQPIDPAKAQSKMDEHLWYKHVLVGLLIVLIIVILAVLLIWCYRRRRPKPSSEKRTFKKRKPIVLDPEIELKPIPGKPLVLPDDDPSFPPSYISETSLDRPMYSDSDEDEEDYGKRSPSVRYEPPPPFYQAMDDDDPRNSPPPAYLMPPLY